MNDDPKKSEFYRLGREQRVDEALRFLDKNPELAKRQDMFYSCADTFACPLLAKCIDLGAEVNQVDQLGLSALWYAIGAMDIEKVRLLLDSGVHPNLGWSISRLVNSCPEERLPVRLEIFRLMMEYGADVNQSSRSNPGYNLLLKAQEYCDDELFALITEYGGKPTKIYLDALDREPVELDWGTFEARLIAALRTAWTEVIESHSNERFFLFGIETNDDVSLLTPFCNTEERAATENKIFGEEPVVKWAMSPDLSLYGAGKEHTESLAQELNFGSLEKWSVTKQKRMKKVFESALKHLDDEGLFGTGAQREKVILGIEIIDADSDGEREMLRIQKRLNPPASMKPLLQALKNLK
ncbi:MAG: DUF4303 domain-containing protein [Pirellulaceae bacterium]